MTFEEQQILFTTLGGSFGLLHLLLYLFSRNSRSNLYFALFSFSFALTLYLDTASAMATSQPAMLTLLGWNRLLAPFVLIFALLFLYGSFEDHIPRRFYIWVVLMAAAGVWGFMDPLNISVRLLMLGIMMADSIYVLTSAVSDGREGAWIIAVGFTLFALGVIYDFLVDLGVMLPWWQVQNGYPFGYAGLIGTMSVYLARDFAQRNERILEQERENMQLENERKLLELEDRRKTAELKEAREFQQGLLPVDPPGHPHYETAFHQQTSAEVGGDYYDCRLEPDQSLTIAVGDAAGHGLRAGMVAAVAKSLFVSANEIVDLPGFLRGASKVFRRMKLRKYFMALWLVRLSDDQVELCAAGMPPVLVYRRNKDVVDEIKLRSMPVGGPVNFPYRSESLKLGKDDLLLVASDGLAECINHRDMMLGEGRLKVLFRRSARRHTGAEDVLSQLIHQVDEWRGPAALRDDLTLCVVKAKVFLKYSG